MANSKSKGNNPNAQESSSAKTESGVSVNNKNAAITETTSESKSETPVAETANKPPESTSGTPAYNINELAGASRERWGVPSEVVYAALRTAGKQNVTLNEADETIKTFLKKEVK